MQSSLPYLLPMRECVMTVPMQHCSNSHYQFQLRESQLPNSGEALNSPMLRPESTSEALRRRRRGREEVGYGGGEGKPSYPGNYHEPHRAFGLSGQLFPCWLPYFGVEGRGGTEVRRTSAALSLSCWDGSVILSYRLVSSSLSRVARFVWQARLPSSIMRRWMASWACTSPSHISIILQSLEDTGI
jgi:hypothetical protein